MHAMTTTLTSGRFFYHATSKHPYTVSSRSIFPLSLCCLQSDCLPVCDGCTANGQTRPVLLRSVIPYALVVMGQYRHFNVDIYRRQECYVMPCVYWLATLKDISDPYCQTTCLHPTPFVCPQLGYCIIAVASHVVSSGLFFITSAKEVMFLPEFVCLFVCVSAR